MNEELLAQFREKFPSQRIWVRDADDIQNIFVIEDFIAKNCLSKKEVARVIEEHKGIYGASSPTGNVLTDLSKALGLAEKGV